MLNFLKSLFSLVLVSASLLSCSAEVDSAQNLPLSVDATARIDPCELQRVGDWFSVGEPFMLSWCRGCHSRDLPSGSRGGAPLEINFDTRTDFDLRVVQIRARVMDGTMPPAMTLSEAEKEAFLDWVNCGSP